MIKKTLILTALFSMFMASSARAEKQESVSLEDIVARNSRPFVCQIGSFKVKVISEKGSEKLVRLSGAGMLINSGWLHFSVGSNPEIRYVLPDAEKIADGATISVFCSGSKKDYDPKVKIAYVEFYVLAD